MSVIQKSFIPNDHFAENAESSSRTPSRTFAESYVPVAILNICPSTRSLPCGQPAHDLAGVGFHLPLLHVDPAQRDSQLPILHNN